MARDLQYKNPAQEFELQDTNGVCDVRGKIQWRKSVKGYELLQAKMCADAM